MNTWLILAIIGPLLWATSNVLDGYVRKNHIQNDFYLSLFSSLFKLPAVILLFLIIDFHYPGHLLFLQMLGAGLLWGLPLFLYFKAFDYDEASSISIYIQLLPIPTLFIASFVLNETLTPLQLLGFAIMLIGGILAATKRLTNSFHLSKALPLILAALVVWAFSDVYFKKLEPDFANYTSAFFVYLLGSFTSSFIVYFMPIKGRKDRNLKKHLNPAGLNLLNLSSTLAVIGTLSFAYALTLGKASLTVLAVGLQPIFVILWTFLLKKVLPKIESDKMTLQTVMLKLISLSLLLAGLLLIQ